MSIRKKDVKIGGHYAIRHGGEHGLSVIRILRPYPYGNGGWYALKLKTNREIVIRSAAKLRFEVEHAPAGQKGWRRIPA